MIRLNVVGQPVSLRIVQPVVNLAVKEAVAVDGIVADRYDGTYDVTPSARAQTLFTEQKLMEKNVEIKAIPFFETTNQSGGTTIYIGSEVT